jgi:hypothetical protein
MLGPTSPASGITTSTRRSIARGARGRTRRLAATHCRSCSQGLDEQVIGATLRIVNVSSGADVIQAVADMKGLYSVNLVLNASTPEIVLDKTLVLGPDTMYMNSLSFYLAGSNNTQRVTLRCGNATTGVRITCAPPSSRVPCMLPPMSSAAQPCRVICRICGAVHLLLATTPHIL